MIAVRWFFSTYTSSRWLCTSIEKMARYTDKCEANYSTLCLSSNSELNVGFVHQWPISIHKNLQFTPVGRQFVKRTRYIAFISIDEWYSPEVDFISVFCPSSAGSMLPLIELKAVFS